MTKDEVIKQAYGQHFEKIKYYINWEDGSLPWFINADIDEGRSLCSSLGFSWDQIDHIDNDLGIDRWRPISLQGIEHNNGWIKIESEADFPKEKMLYFIENNKPNMIFYSTNMIVDLDNLIEMWEDGIITHYQPIIKPQPPIY